MSDTKPYILFFDHEITPTNPFELAIYSHWYPSPFTAPPLSFPSLSHRPPPSRSQQVSTTNLTFKTAEHWMMYHKALLFDPSLCENILSAETPSEAKELGRKVKHFDRGKWNEEADYIVERGNYLKFTDEKNGRLLDALRKTGGKRMVECNPDDRIWGIGWSVEEAEDHMDDWGANRMGDALGKARDQILKETS